MWIWFADEKNSHFVKACFLKLTTYKITSDKHLSAYANLSPSVLSTSIPQHCWIVGFFDVYLQQKR